MTETPRPFTFKYRTVGYGTPFQSNPSARIGWSTNKPDPQLHYNEIVVDVGSQCNGYDDCALQIYDHHFQREDMKEKVRGSPIFNYGSAAVTVLANVKAIAGFVQRLRASKIDTVWIVSHQTPDFDACCSSYIVRQLLTHPAWLDVLAKLADADHLYSWQIDRVPVELEGSPLELRVIFMLAVYAARVDNCRPDLCPREESLRFIFQAALKRGTISDKVTDAPEFFDAVVDTAITDKLNLLIDGFCDRRGRFDLEVAYIRSQEPAYARDMRRATIRSVPVAKSLIKFSEWAAEVRQLSFWENGELGEFYQNLVSAQSTGLSRQVLGDRRQLVDGLFIQDPECGFFKDWVRQDSAGSPRGEGFRFTGISYRGSPNRYFFSLDPEYARPQNLHLYDLWATLQAKEGAPADVEPSRGGGRKDILAQAHDPEAGWGDPWYDGGAFGGTIVVTPQSGARYPRATTYGPTVSEDPIMHVVGRWASRTFYANDTEAGIGVAERVVYSWNEKEPNDGVIGKDATFKFEDLSSGSEKLQLASDRSSLTYGQIYLSRAVCGEQERDFAHSAPQIGEMLWRLISSHPAGIPTDFHSRHLIVGGGWVAVWNRGGIAVAAAKGSDYGLFEGLRKDVKDLAEIMARIDWILSGNPDNKPPDDEIEKRLQYSRQLIERLVRLERQSKSIEGRILRPFLEAVGMDKIAMEIDTLDNVYRAQLQGTRDHEERIFDEDAMERDEAEKRRDKLLTNVLAVASALGLGFSWLQLDGAKIFFGAEDHPNVWSYGGALILTVLLLLIYFLFYILGSGRAFQPKVDRKTPGSATSQPLDAK